jgi:hypothetical protein
VPATLPPALTPRGMTLDGANLGSDYCRRSGAVVSLLHFQVLDARGSRLPDARVAPAYGFDHLL